MALRTAPGQLYEIYDMSPAELQTELGHARALAGAANPGWQAWMHHIQQELQEQMAGASVLSGIAGIELQDSCSGNGGGDGVHASGHSGGSQREEAPQRGLAAAAAHAPRASYDIECAEDAPELSAGAARDAEKNRRAKGGGRRARGKTKKSPGAPAWAAGGGADDPPSDSARPHPGQRAPSEHSSAEPQESQPHAAEPAPRKQPKQSKQPKQMAAPKPKPKPKPKAKPKTKPAKVVQLGLDPAAPAPAPPAPAPAPAPAIAPDPVPQRAPTLAPAPAATRAPAPAPALTISIPPTAEDNVSPSAPAQAERPEPSPGFRSGFRLPSTSAVPVAPAPAPQPHPQLQPQERLPRQEEQQRTAAADGWLQKENRVPVHQAAVAQDATSNLRLQMRMQVTRQHTHLASCRNRRQPLYGFDLKPAHALQQLESKASEERKKEASLKNAAVAQAEHEAQVLAAHRAEAAAKLAAVAKIAAVPADSNDSEATPPNDRLLDAGVLANQPAGVKRRTASPLKTRHDHKPTPWDRDRAGRTSPTRTGPGAAAADADASGGPQRSVDGSAPSDVEHENPPANPPPRTLGPPVSNQASLASKITAVQDRPSSEPSRGPRIVQSPLLTNNECPERGPVFDGRRAKIAASLPAPLRPERAAACAAAWGSSMSDQQADAAEPEPEIPTQGSRARVKAAEGGGRQSLVAKSTSKSSEGEHPADARYLLLTAGLNPTRLMLLMMLMFVVGASRCSPERPVPAACGAV